VEHADARLATVNKMMLKILRMVGPIELEKAGS
jgi:hypothetical protein